MSFVLDNSVAMHWFFGDGAAKERAYAEAVLDEMKQGHGLVPGLWPLEVANALARVEAKGLVREAQSEAFIGLLGKLDIRVDGDTAHRALSTTIELARRYKLSAYDAAYLELALREGLPLATLDEALRKAAAKAGVPLFKRAP